MHSMRVPGVEALREALAGLGLDSRGHKDVLKKRLRAAGKRDEREGRHRRHLKALRDARTRPVGQDFDSYLVLDFEATCQRHEPKHGDFFGFPNEVYLHYQYILIRPSLTAGIFARDLPDH